MQRIGASTATSTTPAIGLCISFDRRNTNRGTYPAIPTTSTKTLIAGTTIMDTGATIMDMDTMIVSTTTTIDVRQNPSWRAFVREEC